MGEGSGRGHGPAMDFELLSSFAELDVCVFVCVHMYIYIARASFYVSHPGAGRKKNLYSRLSYF